MILSLPYTPIIVGPPRLDLQGVCCIIGFMRRHQAGRVMADNINAVFIEAVLDFLQNIGSPIGSTDDLSTFNHGASI